MRYRLLGNSELKVSTIGLGTWVLGGDHWGSIDDRESIATIQKAIDCGINLVDTAPAYGYGHSEELIGKAIKGHRNQMVIATKCGVHRKGMTEFFFILKPHMIRKELEDSLKRMGIEVIDLYQCHWPDPNIPIEDTMEEMLKMQSEGKIRYIGVSNFDTNLLERALKVASIVSVQPQYSLLERSIEKDVLPFCKEHNIGVMAYGSLGSGILSGKYKELPRFHKDDARSFFYPYYKEPYWSRTQELIKEMQQIADQHGKPVAHVAINWVCQQPGVTTALVGARNPEQVEINAAAGMWELSDEELNRIEEALNRIFNPSHLSSHI